jgi:hypothetical protein
LHDEPYWYCDDEEPYWPSEEPYCPHADLYWWDALEALFAIAGAP